MTDVPFEPLSKLEYDPFGNFDYASTERKIIERLTGGARVPYDAPRWSLERATHQARVTIGQWIAEAMGDLPYCMDCGTPLTEAYLVKRRSHFLYRCTKCWQEYRDERKGYDQNASTKELVEEMAKSIGEKVASELRREHMSWRRW